MKRTCHIGNWALSALTAAVVAVAPVALLAQPGHAAGCTKTWTAAVNGNWTDATKWSPAVVPSGTDDVCISIAGTYTVTLAGGASVNSLAVGGAVTGTVTVDVMGANTALALAAPSSIAANGNLVVESSAGAYSILNGAGPLTNNGGLQFVQGVSGGIRYLRVPLTNTATGVVNVTSNNVIQDSNTTTTSAGQFTVNAGAVVNIAAGGFTHSGGQIANAGTFATSSTTFTQSGGTLAGTPLVLGSGTTLVDSAGTGSLQLIGTTTLSGTIPAGQTVTVLGGPGGSAVSHLSGNVINNGTLAMTSTNSNYVVIDSATLLTNNASFQVLQGVVSSAKYVRVPFTNSATGTISITSDDALFDTNTTTTNNGTITTSATAILSISAGTFTNTGGTITNSGTIATSGMTFNESGGATTANPITIGNGTTFVDSLGTGAFNLIGTTVLAGTIPAGQTVTVLGGPGGVAVSHFSGNVTNNGTLKMTSTDTNYTVVDTGTLITNNASLQIVQGVAGSLRYLRVPVLNNAAGTITVTSDSVFQDQATTTTNNGTITTSATAVLNVSAGAITNTSGTITNAGTISLGSATFNQNGGTTSGNPITIGNGSTLADNAGAGAFQLFNTTTLTGTIPTGQTVTISGTAGSAVASLNNATLVNNGTLVMTSANSNYTVLQSGALTNNASVQLLQGAVSSIRYVRIPVTNSATGTVTVTSDNVQQDSNTAVTNNGKWLLGSGAHVTQSAGSSITTSATGTLGFTVNVGTGISQITGGSVITNGKVRVDTVGSPVVGTVYTPVSGATVTGTITGGVFPNQAYTIAKTASTITATVGIPFTMTSSNFTAARDVNKTQITATVNDPTPAASYTGTINWGDATPTINGTFTSNGHGGTLQGTHLWANAGTFTVTTTVTASDGTVIAKTSTVTVSPAPVPTVTTVSPNKIGRNSTNVALIITGTGFTQHSVPSFTGTGITVVSTVVNSATQLTVTVNAGAAATLGLRNVKVTTPGGVATCTNCLTVNAAPVITSTTPNPVRGMTKTVTVNGTGFVAGLTVTTTITGATLGAPTAITATHFTITITVPAGTATGAYQITVKNVDKGTGSHAITVA